MLEQICRILQELFGINTDNISATTQLTGDIELNSIDIINFISAIEEEFDIEIADRDIYKMVTIEDLMEYIKERKRESI